jgi:hypothetical protein
VEEGKRLGDEGGECAEMGGIASGIGRALKNYRGEGEERKEEEAIEARPRGMENKANTQCSNKTQDN